MDGGVDGRFAITTSIPLIPIKSRSDDIADQLLTTWTGVSMAGLL